MNLSSDTKEAFYKSNEILKQIESMCEYLLILIKDLNYFCNIQINKDPPKMEIEYVDLRSKVIPFCRQIGESLIHKLNKKKIKISVENSLPLGFKFRTDEIKLKQILINLISNAVKFTYEGVIKMIVNLVVVKNQVIFEVSDSGIGMNSEQLQNLGSPYEKGASNKNKYGSGLGLYVVSQILKQLGTQLKYSSIVGNGSTFSFSQKAYCNNEQDTQNFNSSIPESLLLEGDSKAITLKLEDMEIELFNKFHLDYARGQLSSNENKSAFYRSISENDTVPQCVFLDTKENMLSNACSSYYIVVDDEKFTRQATLRV